jgi:hypothetical protein
MSWLVGSVGLDPVRTFWKTESHTTRPRWSAPNLLTIPTTILWFTSKHTRWGLQINGANLRGPIGCSNQDSPVGWRCNDKCISRDPGANLEMKTYTCACIRVEIYYITKRSAIRLCAGEFRGFFMSGIAADFPWGRFARYMNRKAMRV